MQIQSTKNVGNVSMGIINQAKKTNNNSNNA